MTMNELLEKIYKQSAYSSLTTNKTTFDEQKVGSPVYGEITQKGTQAIINKFTEHFHKDTVFYDLGSGLGKMVFHVGLVVGAKSTGIEYSKERHSGATKIKEFYIPDYENISFKNDNVLNVDISDATVVYMDNTVFPDNICLETYNNISSGCLLLYKKKFRSKNIQEEQSFDKDLVDRTYNQNMLFWLIKS